MPEGKLAFYRISSRTLYGWKDLVIPAVFEELKSEITTLKQENSGLKNDKDTLTQDNKKLRLDHYGR